jgi:uncharacterized SAM-binding protein YcdF (DUF218 family)
MSILREIVLPSGIVTALIVLGFVALLFRRWRARAWIPLAGAGVVYLLFSNGLVATLLLAPLEYEHPALHDPAQYPDVDLIVVLTAYGAEDPDMPFSSLLNGSSAFRVIEAANLHVRRPKARILVSGGNPVASIMAGQLQRFGVPPASISIDSDSQDTSQSAAHVGSVATGESVFLVTSAGHMSRAMATFRRHGVDAIPAPTDYQLPRDPRRASWTQSSNHLHMSDLAMHEYLGRLWYRLTGRG